MSKVDAYAEKYGVPVEVIDLIDRERIRELVEFNEVEAVPIIFGALASWHREHGLRWLRANAKMLRSQLPEVKGAL